MRVAFDLVFDNESIEPQHQSDLSHFDQLKLELSLKPNALSAIEELSGKMTDAQNAINDNQTILTQGTVAATISISAGFAAWALRSGALLASLFASTPLWRQFDPLPVLGTDDDEVEEDDDIDLFGRND